MSVYTWAEEFCPNVTWHKLSWLNAVRHSLRKWEGLKVRNLRRHGITALHVMRMHGINSDSCALCQLGKARRPAGVYEYCSHCPLYRVRGGIRCDRSETKAQSPYAAFSVPLADMEGTPNPGPMIYWLKRALQYAAKHRM